MNVASFAEAVPNLAGAAMLLLGLFLPTRRRPDAAARLVAWQGGLLALAAASAAWSGAAAPSFWFVAFGALAGRALLLPALLRMATDGGGAAAREAAGPAPLLLGGGLAVLAVAAVVPTGAGVASGTQEGLALALATLLVGVLAMRLRRGVFSGLAGLVAAENGALLGLVHAGEALPGAAALAVLSPGFVACVALAAARGGGTQGVSMRTLFRAARR